MFNGKETVRIKMLNKFLNFCDFFQKKNKKKKMKKLTSGKKIAHTKICWKITHKHTHIHF